MSSSCLSTDIAIIGMAALFPGARDVQAYWQNILNKVDAVQEAPDSWIGSYLEPNSTGNDRLYTSKGGFLGKLAQFNPVEFGIMPNSVDGADPDHFLALKVARDALKDAGYLERSFNHTKAGIILGRGTYINRGFGTWMQHSLIVDQTLNLLQQLNPELTPETLAILRKELKASLPTFTAETTPGVVPNIVTGRIANRLDLMGPNYLIDAACSSSLIAVELAIKELLSGNCDLMLAGGVQASTPPQVHMIFNQLGGLSRSNIRPFDEAANGTLLSEGLGVLALKRLSDAERDSDRIYAVIKAIGVSSDGKGLGLLAPRSEGQVLALERAYQESGIDPDTVTLVEAHGTGMPLGDQTEIQSMTRIFGQRQGQLPHRALGSVKSMIGHCIPAAGAASLIKTTLALYHKILPPTLCDQINPALGIEKTSFYINTQARPWIHGNPEVPRRAGVNAFGFGGINTHAILEEYTTPQTQDTKLFHQQWSSELLIFSADNRQSLMTLINDVQQLIQSNSEISLAQLAYTLSTRPPSTHRLSVIAKDIPDLQTKLNFAADKLKDAKRTQLQTRSGIYYAEYDPTVNPGKIAFLFPGEGSQYPNMLADLCLYFPQVRTWFDFLDEIFVGTRQDLPSRYIFPPPLGLTTEERASATKQLFNVDIATGTVFTASMAIYELLKDFNIPYDVMLGHSTGEHTALVASGTLHFASRTEYIDRIKQLLQIHRDLENADIMPKGQLLAVGAIDSSFLKQLVEQSQGELYLAMDNCPNQVVLFGSAAQIDKAQAQINEAGGICSRLPFDRAYHTPLFDSVVTALQPYYEALNFVPGQTCLYSCSTTDVFPNQPEAIRTVASQQWSSPVLFRETLEKLYHNGVRIFIEVGSSSSLTAFVDDTLSNRDHLALSSNSQRRSGLEQILHLLARLFVKGVAVDVSPLYRHRELSSISLKPVVSEKDKPKAIPILDLTMPVMRLAPDVAQAIQEKLHPQPKAQFNPEPMPTLISQKNPDGNGSLTEGLHNLNKDGVANEAFYTSNANEVANEAFYTPLDTRFAALSGHFELMQEFLASQGRVATALYSNPITYSDTEAGDFLTFEQTWPLLGQVFEKDAQHLYCQRRFDIELDRFLYDHPLVGSKLSERHPELLPLTVMPFAVSMEILAEAANCLLDGQHYVVGLYNVRSYRWIALEQGQLTLDIVAQLQPSCDRQIQDVHVQLYQVGISENSDRLLVFEGDVKLSEQPLPSPAPMAFGLENPQPYSFPDQELYGTGMFHGPCFQGVKHIHQANDQGIEAELRLIEIDNFFSHIPQPRFQINAPLLDAAVQLVAYWLVELIGKHFHTFPFQITAFQQYGAPPPPGRTVLGRGVMAFTSDKQIDSSYELLDETGRVIAQIDGSLQVFLPLPVNYHECFMNPQTAYLSQPWLQQETGLVCRRVEPLPNGFFDELGGVIKYVAAHFILDEQEREFWNNLPEKGSRRTEWLLGRFVAKDVVRQWAKQTFNLDLAPVDIRILPSNLGKPLLHCPELEACTPLPDLSISHSRNYFVVALSLPGKSIGIDLQRLDAVRSNDWYDSAFTSLELDLLAQVPQQNKSTIILGAWCAKEAAAKAAGTGLGGNPKQWQVTDYDLTAQKIAIAHGGESFEVKLYWGDDEILAVCHQ